MRLIPVQPDTRLLRRAPIAQAVACALAVAVALAGFFQYSPHIQQTGIIVAEAVDFDAARRLWDVPRFTDLLAIETDRHSDRGSDPTTGPAPTLGWTIDAHAEEYAPRMAMLDVTHDVSECARRGMRTSGRHPPL